MPDTPVMRQYRELKERHPESVLFFRLGDFYEMFGDDARLAAPILGLVLTSRQGVPMCGVPWHNKGHYIAKLLQAGRKVAVAEQIEGGGAGAETSKKLFKRDVVRVVTPGTVIEDDLLEPSSANFLAAIERDVVGWGLACLDVSTGEFWAAQSLNDRGERRLAELLARVRPSEILLGPARGEEDSSGAVPASACATIYDPPPVQDEPEWTKDSVWANHPLARRAALKCRAYVNESKLHLRDLAVPAYREAAEEMALDETAIRTLELVESASGERAPSLWSLLDRAGTAMGSRKIKEWILRPSLDLPEIEFRQQAVEELSESPLARTQISAVLREISDLPRLINRLGTREAGPRDLAGLRDSLDRFPDIDAWLRGMGEHSAFLNLAARWNEPSKELARCAEMLDRELAEEPPAKLSDGGLIKPGVNPELDELRALKSDSRRFLEELEAKERQETGIASMRAGYNSVFGYYFEVTKAHQAKVPARFVRKQTLTNAERYITPELKEFENKILGAEEKIIRLEGRLFEDLRQRTSDYHEAVLAAAAVISEMDALAALAEVACLHGFIKPTVDLSHDFDIEDGRHPVLAALLPAGEFVPNSIRLDGRDPQIAILTGPNMAGKSTYLRQNALIALMAQMGSFVPAKSAKIGLVDRILTRIGAQDAIAKGDSTFMVEMKETAHILKSATARSLLILDEVGRGTSTFDGISIAWAVLEHLNSAYRREEQDGQDGVRGPRVLFATHYFELTELAKLLEGVANFNVEVKEWTNARGQAEVVFLHKISEGPADRSYGIHVAGLAGLPPQVVARAHEILEKLETESASGKISGSGAASASGQAELPLFGGNAVLEALRFLDPERMTPMEALSALQELKKRLS